MAWGFFGSRKEDGVWHEVRGAVRALRTSPLVTGAMVGTIALGIGASTAIFSVAEGVILRPLPYAQAERLVVVTGEMRTRRTGNLPLSSPDFLDLQKLAAGTFRDLAAVQTRRVLHPQADGAPEQIRIASVSANFFATLGVSMTMGRDFVDEDGWRPTDAPADANEPWDTSTAAILSYEYWQRRYGGRPEVLGAVLPRSAARIVGVAAPGFELMLPAQSGIERAPDIWFAARLSAEEKSRATFAYRVIGRLRNGVALEAARAQADAAAAQLRTQFPLWQSADFHLALEPLHHYLVAEAAPALFALSGAAICLLLIGCANVANLLLVRVSIRQREVAVRAALGASRWQIVRQMLLEALTVAGLGTLVGVGLAWAGLRALLAVAPPDIPRLDIVSINPTVLVFAGLLGLVAAATFGLLPALGGSRADVAGVLRAGNRTSGLHAGGRLRDVTVVVEIALSFVLLIGSGLMLRSFAALQAIDPGFVAPGLLTFQVVAPQLDHPDQREALMRDLREQFARLPGVQQVTAASPFPLADRFNAIRWGAEDALTDAARFQSADFQAVLPGYFETLGARLHAGRTFTDADNRAGVNRVLIDRALAARAFPGGSAVGRRLLVRIRTAEPEWVEVIGVVGHQRLSSLAAPGRVQIYFTDAFLGHGRATRWAIRTNGDPSRYREALQSVAAARSGQLLVTEVQTMNDLVHRAQASTRFSVLLIGMLGATGVLLAAIGIYGVLSSVVRQRTAEIGVRMAMGAAPRAVLGLVLRRGLMLGAIGVSLGLGASLSVSHVMTSILVGIEATDSRTFVTTVVLFVMMVAGASWLPARRAARLDPVVTLRRD
jgi:predicted permease